MCGITGIFHFDKQRTVNNETLKRMSDSIAHRGPDAEGFYSNGPLGLAHRRLAIIDLCSGAQPMYSDDGKIALVFNGEIYNYIEIQKELELLGHHFKTYSDTEVIIRAYQQWGTDCQEKFNGMWAFAVWDSRKQLLFLSRDRMGEKPIYYGILDNTFLFGSEVKSINSYGEQLIPDTDMLELYMFLGYIPEPYSFYKNVKKLKAGHFLIVRDGNIQDYKYWDLPEVNEQDLLKDELKITGEFAELFHDSIKLRMRSDVAYGAFLSGGLDSSSIVATMTTLSNKPIKTFTIGFEEHMFDERPMATLVAERFKTEHHDYVVQPDTLERSLKEILFHYDEPFADPAAIPTGIVSKYAGQKVKMVLTGDGADEVLAGYSTYQSEMLVNAYQRLPGFVKNTLPALIRGASSALSGNLRYKINQYLRVVNGMNDTFQNRLISKSIKIPGADLKSLYSTSRFPIEDFMNDALKTCPFKDPFYQLMYYNLKVSLPGQMLVKVDRMSMAHSLETRAPFLDHRIVELMYGVDKKVKLPNFSGVKNVLKKTMRNQLPETIINRKKKGFDVPLREWFKGKTFDDTNIGDVAFEGCNEKHFKQLISGNKNGKADHGTLLWRSLLYSAWCKQF